MKLYLLSALALCLVSCTQTSTTRLSKNEILINTSAAPICGRTGAAKTAERMAAVETIRAGYDGYIIMNAASANNVQMVQMPGTYQTSGTARSFGGYTSFDATTSYRPGMTYAAGTHDQSFAVRMFKNGEPGSNSAIPARSVLGPKWEEAVKNGINTCAGT